MLFYDPLLSATDTMSCATCHQLDRSFSSQMDFDNGINGLPRSRHATSIINAAWMTSFFWDGRALSLEDQVLDVLSTHGEFEGALDRLLADLNASDIYPNLFK